MNAVLPDDTRVSPVRSVGLAAAISLHVALLLALMMPIAAPPMAEVEAPPIVQVDVIPAPPPPPIPPPPPPVAQPVVAPRPAVTPIAVPTPVAMSVLDSPSPIDIPAEPSMPTVDPGAIDTASLGAGPAIANLRLIEGGAPRYPRRALMQRVEGEVELLIVVGTDGRALEVTIARSSGDADLDRAAREHAKRRWVFEPAQRNGIAVTAWARVPVNFTLPE